MAAQVALNAIGPAIVLKHLRRLLPRDRPAQVAVLSARVGSIGDNAMGGWYGDRAAKAALNQLVHTAAIELARTHPQLTLIALHPGTVSTNLGPTYRAGPAAQEPAEAAGHLIAVVQGMQPGASGGFFDWRGKRVVWQGAAICSSLPCGRSSQRLPARNDRKGVTSPGQFLSAGGASTTGASGGAVRMPFFQTSSATSPLL